MKIVRWNPRVSNLQWLNEFDNYVQRELQRPGWIDNGHLQLAVDVSENDEGYVVTASVPGVRPEDIEITIEDDVLSIKGETISEQEIEKENYHIRERRHGSFGRTLRFPVQVNAEAIEANVEHGVLTLSVPKAEEVKPKRIEVKVS